MAVVEPAARSWLALAAPGPPGSGFQAHREVLLVSESVLPNSDDAILQDLLEVRALIEQAKGILMATYRCGPDEAFDLLRKASQRANVKLHVIAERLVERAASGGTPAPL